MTDNESNSIDIEQPDPISFKHHVFDFSFHPTNNLVVAGLINGLVQCYEYDTRQENKLVWSTKISKKSCRGVEFTPGGAHILSISRDKSIQALDLASEGRILYKIPKAHKYPINKICNLDTHLISTGDDEGIVKIWDMRTCKQIQEYQVHDDYISDLKYNATKSTLVATGGDGVLSVYDIRRCADKKADISSQVNDDGLLSLAVVENGSRVIAGSEKGVLYSWNWGRQGWNGDEEKVKKLLGHPNSIDAICALDDKTICTGGNDGLLRLISLTPNYRFEGILGDHGEDFPIECIKMSQSEHQRLLASCAHDLSIRFWNVQDMFNEEQEAAHFDDDDDKQKNHTDNGEKSKRGLLDVDTSLARKSENDVMSDTQPTVKKRKTRQEGFFDDL